MNTPKLCCSEAPVIESSPGQPLCKKHFVEQFESKVFKTIRQFDLLGKKEHIGIALSGGKDSLTALHLVKKLADQNPNLKLGAILINEGIAGYRDKTIVTAEKICKEFEIPLHIYSYEEEFGMPLDEILKRMDIKPCTICGVFRRYLLNKKSRELGFSVVITGHNMDDECQSILMNQLKNNMAASARLGPKVGIATNEKFVQRIKPLYLCSEKEVATYAFLNGILDEFTECPNVRVSFRAQVRDMLNNFEKDNPGSKNAIIHSFLDTLPLLKSQYKQTALQECTQCGEYSAKEVCNACMYADKVATLRAK